MSAEARRCTVVLPFTNPQFPNGVAVDGTGNLYVTDSGHQRVLKLAAGTTTGLPSITPAAAFTSLTPTCVWWPSCRPEPTSRLNWCSPAFTVACRRAVEGC
ncbi:hypothetical protein PJN26_11275 [Mycobacterium kansasii]